MNDARLPAREYKKLAALLTRWTGINLHAKEHLMLGRLQPRLRALALADFSEYAALLEGGGPRGPEAQHFINALTTNKTSFFRESHHFDFLTQRVFPEARARAAQGGAKRLRLWSAGCSRGAEPYSMALLAAEQLPAAHGWDVRILATDLDTDVLAQAGSGVYEESEIAAVPDALRKRYFVRAAARDGGSFKVHADAASLVTFAQANLIAQPFPVRGRFDAVFCRNVMIYFDRPTQERVVAELVQRITATGYLLIGHSESMLAQHLPRASATVGVYRRPAAQGGSEPRAPRSAPARTRGRVRVPVAGLPVQRIVLGEWFASGEPVLVSTLLGSCVAACLFDPVARVGGMNHFMLPKVVQAEEEACARFGVHAMEVLINDLMQRGAQRSRLQAMAFGAGAVNRALSSTVAAQNGAFVRQFLAKEQIPLVCERLGGSAPREVYLRADTGDAFVRAVEPSRIAQLSKRELAAYAREPQAAKAWSPDDALF